MTIKKAVKIYQDRYVRENELGSGSYGTVYKVYDQKTKNYYAMKVEHGDRDKDTIPTETKVYRKLVGKKGFLQVIDHFQGSYRQNHMVVTLVGQSLGNHLHKLVLNKKKELQVPDLKTVALIAIQLIERLEVLHAAGFLHRDLKPDNLAMGLGEDSSTLYILDLGIAKQFKLEGNYHISKERVSKVCGNVKYTSLNSHKKITLSRRDDLESTAYILIRMLKGRLPWNEDREKDIIFRKKLATPKSLCSGLEQEFEKYLTYIRNLHFKDKPDYELLKKIFRDLLKRKGFEEDGIYCWSLPTDPAVVKKKKEIEQKKLELEKKNREEQVRKAKASRKKFNRYILHNPSQDLIFPNNIPLEDKRKIIQENMKDAHFPNLLPFVYPPSGEYLVKPPQKVKAAAADVNAKGVKDENSNILMDIDNVDHKVVAEKKGDAVKGDIEHIDIDKDKPAVAAATERMDIDKKDKPKNDGKDSDADKVELVIAVELMDVDKVKATAVEDMDIDKEVPKVPVVQDENKKESSGDKKPATDIQPMEIVPAPGTQGKKNKKKNKKSAAVQQQDPNRETRKEQQAKLLALAQKQAQQEVEWRKKKTEKEQQLKKRQNYSSEHPAYGKSKNYNLPRFQQRANAPQPYPTNVFQPTFANPPYYNNYHNNQEKGVFLF